MFYYNICINNGVEAFGTEGKTITVNEVLQTADIKALAREIHHENMLIPEQVAESVLQNFAKAAVNLMSQGFAIQFISGNDVVMRVYPDIHVKGGNINLARAQELIPGTTEITAENAGELVSRAGVTVRAKAECEQKFTEMLMAESSGIQRKEIVEKARVERTDSQGGGSNTGGTGSISTGDQGDQGGTSTGDDSGTSTGGDTGGQQGSYRLVIYKYGSGTMTVTDGNGQVINSNDNEIGRAHV